MSLLSSLANWDTLSLACACAAIAARAYDSPRWSGIASSCALLFALFARRREAQLRAGSGPALPSLNASTNGRPRDHAGVAGRAS
jgi:hypothetical protein